MPLEIKELVIRAVVNRADIPVQAGDAPDTATHGRPGTLSADERHQLVSAAAREVLRVLRAAKER